MDSKMNCVCSVLEEIDGFQSISEFRRFQQYLHGLVVQTELLEIPVGERFAGFAEQWYRCNECKQVWRLVHPDFPFKGLWTKVDPD